MRLLISCSCDQCVADRRRIRKMIEYQARLSAISGAKQSTTGVKRAGSWGVEQPSRAIAKEPILPSKYYKGERVSTPEIVCIACGVSLVGQFYRTGYVPIGKVAKREIIPVIMPNGTLVLDTKTRVFDGTNHGPLCEECASDPHYRIDPKPYEHIPAREFGE